jgi:hypothetical protein
MNPKQLIDECRQSGVSVRLDGNRIKVRGEPLAVKAATTLLRPYKAELLKYLTVAANDGAEVDGPHTAYCTVSPLAIREFHDLIARYVALYRLSDDAATRIIETAKKQSLASIPASICSFRKELGEH